MSSIKRNMVLFLKLNSTKSTLPSNEQHANDYCIDYVWYECYIKPETKSICNRLKNSYKQGYYVIYWPQHSPFSNFAFDDVFDTFLHSSFVTLFTFTNTLQWQPSYEKHIFLIEFISDLLLKKSSMYQNLHWRWSTSEYWINPMNGQSS